MSQREDVRCTRLGVQICRVRGQTAVDQVIAQQPEPLHRETVPRWLRRAWNTSGKGIDRSLKSSVALRRPPR